MNILVSSNCTFHKVSSEEVLRDGGGDISDINMRRLFITYFDGGKERHKRETIGGTGATTYHSVEKKSVVRF